MVTEKGKRRKNEISGVRESSTGGTNTTEQIPKGPQTEGTTMLGHPGHVLVTVSDRVVTSSPETVVELVSL